MSLEREGFRGRSCGVAVDAPLDAFLIDFFRGRRLGQATSHFSPMDLISQQPASVPF